MNSEKKKAVLKLLRLIPPLVCIILIITYFLFGKDISAEEILHYTPANPWLAAAFFVLLYSIKSLSVFFPLMILHIAVGVLFNPAAAVLINLLGTAAVLLLPYGIGRFTGAEFVDQLTKKFPKLAEIIKYQQGNTFFLSFFLRVISCLPGDIVSIYLGMIKIPFNRYFIGSFLGTLPGIITATFIGTSITDPASPVFIISVFLTVAMSVSSFLIYVIWKKKNSSGT